MDFDIPAPGVYLLSGGNGAGKTSLLGCLRRIGQKNAFRLHFPMSEQSEKLDNYSKSKIVYGVDGEEVSYSHTGNRWEPTPRKNSKLIDSFGYPSVIYVGATADRITPRPEDFSPQRLRKPDDNLVDGLKGVFGKTKFDGLRYINLTTGSGNRAFVMQYKAEGVNHYYSEKNFSLGELCVLKLLLKIYDSPDESLVLIDELELALHPKAQIKLFRLLETVSREKSLTVIFSTHSVSLLKTASRKQILHLQQDGGHVTFVPECFPTYALGDIALAEESYPDRIIYVEDEAAKNITDSFVKAVNTVKFDSGSFYPTVHVVPIGPFMSVMRFLGRSDAFLPATTKTSALLDADVKEESVKEWRRRGSHDQLAFFRSESRRLFYLPFTPECGVVAFLRDHHETAQRMLREEFADHRVHVDADDFSDVPINSGK